MTGAMEGVEFEDKRKGDDYDAHTHEETRRMSHAYLVVYA